MTGEDQRRVFRVDFPEPKLGPTLLLEGELYKIADISVESVRYHGTHPRKGTEVKGTIILHNGEWQDIAGVISRIEKDKRVVQLEGELPVKVIQEEAEYIVTHIRRQSGRYSATD